MSPITNTISGWFNSLSDALNIEQISEQVTWLSEVGWNEGSGSQFNRLNYSFTRQISQSGAAVNGHIAATISAFWACAQMIASDIAKLPLNIFTEDAQDNDLISNNHPLFKVISITPDGQIMAQSFWEAYILHCLVWGNGYALIGPRDPSNGQINHLELVHPNLVIVRKDRGIRFYEIFPSAEDLQNRTKIKIVQQEDMFHLHGPGDGFSGWPIANYAKEALGITISLQELQAALFANGMDLGGTLTTTEELDNIHRQQMAEEWTATHSGASNRKKVAVLDMSTVYNQFDNTAVDAEVLESRKFQILEVARFFRVPPHKLGITDAATLNNIEQENIKYVTETISPWIRRIENLMRFRLFADGSNFFAKFDRKPLILADSKTQVEFWEKAIGKGMATPNMAAKDLDLPTYQEGNEHYIDANNSQPIKVANMAAEKEELVMKQMELGNDGAEKNNELIGQEPANNTGHNSAHKDDNPKPKQEEKQFNASELVGIFIYQAFIEDRLQQCIKREITFDQRRQQKIDKFGEDYQEDIEETKRFYNEQTQAYREALCVFFEKTDMPEPKGFINKWVAWQDIEKWADQKAFLIANDLIKHYTGTEDWRDGEYDYDDPLTKQTYTILIENGVLRCN